MINASSYVVVASRDETPGTVIASGPRVQQLQATAALLLPVDSAALTGGGSASASAFQRAEYGGGVEWPAGRPTRGCALNVYLPTGSARVAWVFVVSTRGGVGVAGVNITLTGDVTERGVADVTQVEREVKPSFGNDAFVSGSSIVRAAPRSFATVCLGGVSHDPARVLWLAATVLP